MRVDNYSLDNSIIQFPQIEFDEFKAHISKIELVHDFNVLGPYIETTLTDIPGIDHPLRLATVEHRAWRYDISVDINDLNLCDKAAYTVWNDLVFDRARHTCFISD